MSPHWKLCKILISVEDKHSHLPKVFSSRFMKGFSLCGVVLDIWVKYGQHEFTCLKSQSTHCKYFWWNFPKLVTKYVRSPCRRRVERRQLALVCPGLRRPLPLGFSMYAPCHMKLHLVWHCMKLVYCYPYGLPTPSNIKASKPLITNGYIHQVTYLV